MCAKRLVCGMMIACWSASMLVAAEHTKDSLSEIKAKLDKKKAVLIDVREQSEWDAQHVEGAVFLPLQEMNQRVSDPKYAAELKEKLPADKVLYCHCRAGRRALVAAEALKKLGYDVRPLKPGIQELLDAGFPQAKPPADEAK